jgi:hypothetical protein
VNLDPATLNLAASALIVVVVARIATQSVRFDLWFFGIYALAAGGLAIAALLAFGEHFQIGVFLFGIAAVTGVYWTAASRPHSALDPQGRAIAAIAAIGLAVLLALVAVHYRWWIAPLVLLALMGIGLVVNGVLPAVQAWRRRGVPVEAGAVATGPDRRTPPGPEGPTSSKQGASVSRTPAPAGAPRLPPLSPNPAILPSIAIRCPSCDLAGAVPASKAGRTLTCPRCKALVQIPGSPAASAQAPPSRPTPGAGRRP